MGGAGWLKAIPRPPQEGEPVARGRANEVSDTPGDAASPPRAVSAKALKGGSAPGGRWFKRRTFASRGRCPLIVLLPFQGVDCSCGLPGVALPSVADPGLQANPPSSGLGWPSAIPSNPKICPQAFLQDASHLSPKFPRPLGTRFPAAGNRTPSRGHSMYQPLALGVPAAGTRSTSRGHSKYQPRALDVPALGTRITSPWQSHCQPLAIALPALGNRITSPWQSHCQAVWQIHSQACWPFCTEHGPQRQGLSAWPAISGQQSLQTTFNL